MNSQRSLRHIFRRGSEYLLARSPGIRSLYWTIAPDVYREIVRRRADYSLPFNPIETRWVNPAKITRVTGRKDATRDRWRDIGRVRDGDWDRTSVENGASQSYNTTLFAEELRYRAIKAHFVDGVPWENTNLYREHRDLIGDDPGSRSSDKEISEYFEKIESLYRRIDSQGYKTQLELLEKEGIPEGRVGFLDLLTNEICVDLGRDGEPLFVDGRHRLAIAKILEIDLIPITIIITHKQYI